MPLHGRESSVRLGSGDFLLNLGSCLLKHLLLYVGLSFLRSRPRRQRSCFAGRRYGCAFAH